MGRLVVMSGYPAAGKSTLARAFGRPTQRTKALEPERAALYAKPLGLGPVIRVDTTRAVDLERVASAVLDAFDWRLPTRPCAPSGKRI